jgi:hypothetical protein
VREVFPLLRGDERAGPEGQGQGYQGECVQLPSSLLFDSVRIQAEDFYVKKEKPHLEMGRGGGAGGFSSLLKK